MPRTSRKSRSQPQTMTSRIKAGRVAPLLNNVIGNDLVLGGHTALVNKYATEIN